MNSVSEHFETSINEDFWTTFLLKYLSLKIIDWEWNFDQLQQSENIFVLLCKSYQICRCQVKSYQTGCIHD